MANSDDDSLTKPELYGDWRFPTPTIENPADVEVPIHPVLRHRWSPKGFTDRQISEETLRSILEAARWAPSSYNEQPWRFVVATKYEPETHDQMVEMLTKGNQRWAKSAPVLMLAFVRTTFEKTGAKNRIAAHDLGQSVAQMTVEAVSRGVFVHQMAGIQLKRIRQTYDVPESLKPAVGIALGYAPDPSDLSDDEVELQLKDRARKPLRELAYRGDFDIPFES